MRIIKALKASKSKGLGLTVFISVAYLLFFYWVQIFNANEYMFTDAGDGIKTYYHMLWHSKYDSSYMELNSMNYPYGESLLSEDSMPILNNTLKLFSSVFPGLSNYSVGIINMFFFLCLLLGSLFLYLVLIRFKVTYYWAALAANAIVFLSSQSLLINPAGHFSLTFICYFPLGWYLLIKYLDGRQAIKYSVFIAFNVFFWSFCHVYLGFSLIVFLLSFYFLKFLINNEWKYKIPQIIIHIIIQVFLPLLVVLLLVKLTDKHPDRIDMPLLLGHRSTLYTIFLSDISPIKILYENVFDLSKIHDVNWGRTGTYVGLSTTISLIVFVLFMFKQLLSKKLKVVKKYVTGNEFLFLAASIMVLLYSMAIPLKYISENIVNSIPLIKQFSTLGRFAWVFYYVASVFAISFIAQITKNKKWGKIVLMIVISLHFIESFSYHSKIGELSKKQKNFFVQQNLKDDEKILTQISAIKFQAVLPLPTFFKYNIPFSTAHNNEIINTAFVASIYSGLPVLSVYLSRPSVSESLKSYKLLMPGKYQYKNERIKKDGRNMAIVLMNNYFDKLNANELGLIKAATLLKASNTYSVYSLSIDSLYSREKELCKTTIDSVKEKWIRRENCYTIDSNAYFKYESFDSIPAKISYRGSGAFVAKKNQYSTICTIKSSELELNQEYQLSYWYYNRIWDQTFNTLFIEEKDSLGKTVSYKYFSPLKANLIDGWWYLSEHSFKPITKNGLIRIFFKGGEKFENWFAIDDLLIRPIDKDVYQFDFKNDTSLNCKLNNVEVAVGE